MTGYVNTTYWIEIKSHFNLVAWDASARQGDTLMGRAVWQNRLSCPAMLAR